MKARIVAAAVAVLGGGVAAGNLHHRHVHPDLHKKGYEAHDSCGCVTLTQTIYGEATLLGVTPIELPTTAEVVAVVVPTPAVETCPTPGAYTFPATTITLTETTTVCAASTATVPPGHHTLGGVTTVVETSTAVVCPYATVETHADVVTSVIRTTTYVCPSAGTYTIAPVVTDVVDETVIVVPVVATYAPDTYTRDEIVTTVTDTQVVVVCPFTSSQAAVQPTAQPAPPPAAPAEPEEMDDDPSEDATYLHGDGDHYAMTYTPYSNNGMCKSESEIQVDIAAIAAAGFAAVRVYSTDCNTLEWVGNACASSGVKMMLGIFVGSAGCSNANPSVPQQIDAIASWARWDLVSAIIVGNEAIFNGHCSAAQVASLIAQCKSRFSGYTGPYSTAETVGVWRKSSTKSALCHLIDFTGANIHAYFNAAVTPARAGEFVAKQLGVIDTICPGKKGLNLECGWPSAGNANGKATTGPEEQRVAISGIRSSVGSRTVFFSYHDDLWKEPGSCNCEQSWGCGNLF